MSINATQYIEMRDGLPTIVPTPQGTRGEMMPIGTPALIRIVVDSGETGDGVSFLAWLGDKIRADQEAAKAFAVVDLSRLTADDLVGLGKPGRVERMPVHPGSSAAPLPELPTTISGHAIINEGDAAPSADVVEIARRQFDAP